MALVAIVVLALALRLREPLSSPVIGAEDPYLHMERTWNFVQGDKVIDYPMGLMILLFPFTLLGPDVFYQVARFASPLLGGVAVLGIFFLCRRYVHPTGALAGALVFAVMREAILRTNILFPTALDLALLPFLFLGVLRFTENVPWGLPVTAAISFVYFFVHPWALALVLVPIALLLLVLVARRQAARTWTPAAALGGSAAILGILWILPLWSPTNLILGHAIPRMSELARDPSTFFPLPPFVDLPWMISWPLLLLGGIGAVLAFVRRSRFTLLALLWTFLLLPLVLVDWFDIWFLPHRTVAYLGVGLAMLSAVAVSEFVAFVREARPKALVPAGVGALGIVLVVSLPSALSTEPWYRVYDENDYAAWDALDALDTSYVVAGSWQARAGYRALTGRDAIYNPDFFQTEVVRNYEMQQHPGLVVLVDKYTTEAKVPTGFLSDWRLIGEWGLSKAYAPS